MADILIAKCRIPFLCKLPGQQVKAVLDCLKARKGTGVVLLPIVPDDIEIKLVDENGKENNDGNGKEM